MMSKRLPLLIPDMPSSEELRPYLESIDERRWYTNFGPLVRDFEATLQRTLGTEHVPVTTSSATLALELALAALNLPKEALVLAPAFTFAATITSIVRAGLQPLLADVDPHAWILTPTLARQAMQSFPISAVMPVATFGCPLDSSEWDEFAAETGIPVIIDAAGAFGNQRTCSRATIAFSLHATKAFGTGEGGFVVSSDAALLDRIRSLTNFGIDGRTGHVTAIGTNAKLSEYHAAVGLAAVATWPARRARRRDAAAAYASVLRRACPSIEFQNRPADAAYTIMPIRLPAGVDTQHVAACLGQSGIETRRWYYPVISEHEAFRHLKHAASPFVAQKLAEGILGIPFHMDMTSSDFEYVAQRLALELPSDFSAEGH